MNSADEIDDDTVMYGRKRPWSYWAQQMEETLADALGPEVWAFICDLDEQREFHYDDSTDHHSLAVCRNGSGPAPDHRDHAAGDPYP